MSDDPTSNIKFVEIVEKYPCIYDYNRPDYSKREVKEKAWVKIANETKDSVTNCKEKWKHLRTAFSRSLKKLPSGSGSNKKVKDYYLKDVMQFVLPFLKMNPQSGNLPSTEESTEIFDEGASDASVSNEEEFSHQHETEKLLPEKQGKKRIRSPSPQSNSTCHVTTKPTVKKKAAPKMVENSTDQSIKDYITFKTSSSKKSSPDLDFFKSLLPDVEKMTDPQKRLFKRRVLELIDTIFGDFPQQNIQVSVPLPSPAMSSYSVTSCSNPPTPINQFQQNTQSYVMQDLTGENDARSFIHNFNV